MLVLPQLESDVCVKVVRLHAYCVAGAVFHVKHRQELDEKSRKHFGSKVLRPGSEASGTKTGATYLGGLFGWEAVQ